MHASVGEAIGAMPAKNFNASYTKHCSTSSMVKCSNTALGMSCNSTVRYERDPSDYKIKHIKPFLKESRHLFLEL